MGNPKPYTGESSRPHGWMYQGAWEDTRPSPVVVEAEVHLVV
jgi:hypothetical protein